MAATTVNVEKVTGTLEDSLSKLGFEVYPLKIGWYNSVVPPSWHLAYPDDSLAVVVLSTPAMFEQAFLPFLEDRGCQGLSDPIDQCVKRCVSSAVSQCFPGQKVDVSYDFELLPSRKPKFLAQTAAHVSGAAFYYQQADITDQPWDKKMFGVCMHPRFGGWFAIRALLIFGGVTVGPELVQPAPPDCVPSREDRIKLLEAFNFHWKDWSYRDFVRLIQTYSQKQRDYFATVPAQRFALLRSWGLLSQDSECSDPGSDTLTQVKGHC
ncbi:methylmalonic aciduria and homocystinuria type C protein homolog [Thalassophryne amazonica]|uniref:methylmalonic aciduria and homocystinuria type C protein homolog n=1 Tax=Thalassophryne amazonica TaxID=390379 RepID=UPI001471649D|nr:methylmalonic aciduria and homocystinuria type C protein homolog [Thalassophryne amazonica]